MAQPIFYPGAMDVSRQVESLSSAEHASTAGGEILYRHSLLVRLTHWVNAICLVFLVWSGAAILYAFPQFHIGDEGYVGLEPLLKLPIELDTRYQVWARYMHFAFAWLFVLNGVLYVIHSILSGHIRTDILPRLKQLSFSRLAAEVRVHLPFAGHARKAEREYNALQRIAYTVVIFLLCPLMLLSGLTLGPAIVANFPWLTDIFYGRQTARLVHFITALALLLFVLIHIWQVFAAGFFNQLRSMVTGRYHVSAEGDPS